MDIDFCRAFDERMREAIHQALTHTLVFPNSTYQMEQAIKAACLRSANRAKIEAYEKERKR